jgi:imidazolonepropionase-like amidohydrolase
MAPPAYPKNSYLIRDIIEARDAVNKFADQGASAIKVYFRLPAAIIKAVCYTAHQRGIPVTAHLEITSAMQAIEAGVDGIEHITSFGTDLLPTYEAEQYKQSVLADNNARREGRYQAWSVIDMNNRRVDSLLSFLHQKGTIVSPTLGAFEYRFGEGKTDTVKVRAFENMMTFVGKVNERGIPVVTGSHSWVPYAEVGWAFQREMELLAESGLTNMEVIVASTSSNARFLRIEDRLGSIEEGKLADLLLIEGDPLQDLDAFYHVRKVMLNGVWVD